MNALPLVAWTWSLDGWIIVTGVLCAVAASLLGNFLVLRRMSLLGDAISHAVLPGLAAAFFLTGERSSLAMFVGAVVVGIATAFFTEWVHRIGEVDEGASLGVVFTSLFAIGLLMIVQAADHVDLDPSCVLHGAIETTPLDTWNLVGWEIPRVAFVLLLVLIINASYVTFFFKELKIAAFDPNLATTSGFSATAMHYSLMTLVAITAVASFESVGNILVVAMFVTPAAAARLLTDRLSVMVWLSAAIAAVSAVLGHALATSVPGAFGLRSVSTSGMMAVAVGLLFAAALLFAPRNGILARVYNRLRLALRVVGEDVLGILFRINEGDRGPATDFASLQQHLGCRPLPLRLVLFDMTRRGLLENETSGYHLTPRGAGVARELIRSHRLWEQYLVEQAGLPADRIHREAELFEHVTDRAMRDQLNEATSLSGIDPHGKAIPDEPADSPE